MPLGTEWTPACGRGTIRGMPPRLTDFELETCARALRALAFHEGSSAERISDPASRAPVRKRAQCKRRRRRPTHAATSLYGRSEWRAAAALEPCPARAAARTVRQPLGPEADQVRRPAIGSPAASRLRCNVRASWPRLTRG